MLRSIELENFKAFGQRAKVPLAPITLVFGQNSAGKSSILQALNLLKQTREGRDPSALLLPRAEKGIVDLGSFQELLFDHDLANQLRVRLEVESLDRRAQSMWKRRSPHPVTSVGMEFMFERKSADEEVQLKELELLVQHDTEGLNSIAWFDGLKGVPKKLQRAFYRGLRPNQTFTPSDLRVARCRRVTRDESFWKPYYDSALEHREEIYSALLVTEGRAAEPNRQLGLLDEDDEVDSSQLVEARDFYKSHFGLDSFIRRHADLQKNRYVGLEGFMPVTVPRLGASYDAEYMVFNRVSRARGPVGLFDAGRLAIDVGLQLDRTLERVFPLGPFRTPPKRWYIFTGTSPQDVGYEGELLPDLLYRDKELRAETNEWLRRLEVGYELSIESAGARLRDLYEVRLKDTTRKTPVNVSLSDVGFGISQLLPFVVQSLAGNEQIITIEQPEVHVHPRLQADLGDLLAYAAKKQRNQFVIETHSEHLILRLQKLVRNGDLSSDDVSVLYVRRGGEGSEVLQLHLDEEGDFIDDWPGGFFPERLREIL